jgi:hypothetical protein
MTSLQEFRCEVCGLVTTHPIHWFVIRCGDSELTVHRWNSETANAAGARHYCGEAHAEVCTSVAGLTQYVRRRSQVSCSDRGFDIPQQLERAEPVVDFYLDISRDAVFFRRTGLN